MKEDTTHAHIITLRTPQAEVRLTDFGARILSFIYQGTDCLHGPKTLDDAAADDCYCGAICGRVANRIAGGQFELDGCGYSLACNNGPNSLHGGNLGYSDRVWQIESQTETELVLSLSSPDGEEGYPGCVQLKATYTLQESTLSLRMEAQTDAPTLLNLTNHAYWNLDGTGTIDERHCLQVRAEEYTPMVANIPTGEVCPVAGTPYDLRQPVPFVTRNAPEAPLPGGFDDNYILCGGPGMREVALLTNGRRTLRLHTDAPGLQVYTGDYLPHKRGGVALEAQNYPDSPHHPNFPSIVLRPGEVYCRTISWCLE